MTQRILVAANGPDVDAVKIGLKAIVDIAEESNGHESILFVPTKGNLQGSTIEDALGTNLTKKLLKNGTLGLPNNGKMSLYTLCTFPSFCRAKSVLVIYADEKMLDKTNDASSCDYIVVVPWLADDVQSWVNTWQPEILGDSPELAPVNSGNGLSVVAIEGLKTLTNIVNLSINLSHPCDHDSAVNMLKLLKKNKEHFDPESVKAWALQNDWKAKGANKLSDIANKILEGRRIKTSGDTLNPDLISILRERASS